MSRSKRVDHTSRRAAPVPRGVYATRHPGLAPATGHPRRPASDAQAPRPRSPLIGIGLGVTLGLLLYGWLGAVATSMARNDPAATTQASDPKTTVALQAGAGLQPSSLFENDRGPNAINWLPSSVKAWSDAIVDSSTSHGVDPELVAIVMLVESGGHAGATSPVGAVGLMQVMPATARDIATQRGLTSYSDPQLLQPVLNIDFGTWYLAQQLKAFGRADDDDWVTSIGLAAAAYNGGPGQLQAHLDGSALVAETARYAKWVTGMWIERRSNVSPTFEAWMAAGGWRLMAAADTAVASAR